jgi:hypothetical protein
MIGAKPEKSDQTVSASGCHKCPFGWAEDLRRLRVPFGLPEHSNLVRIASFRQHLPIYRVRRRLRQPRTALDLPRAPKIYQMESIDEIAMTHPLIPAPCPSTRWRTTAFQFDTVRHVVGCGFTMTLRYLLWSD